MKQPQTATYATVELILNQTKWLEGQVLLESVAKEKKSLIIQANYGGSCMYVAKIVLFDILTDV